MVRKPQLRPSVSWFAIMCIRSLRWTKMLTTTPTCKLCTTSSAVPTWSRSASPFMAGHEPLAMRNRLIRYGVTRLGFTAVALETCLSSSKRLYGHVLGRTTEPDSALKEAFCYGFGDLQENLELIRWLRTYNATQQPARQVRLYG